MDTIAKRWRAALREIRALGVQVVGNINSCCAGCIDMEKQLPGFDEDKPYISWLSTQGRAIRFTRDGYFAGKDSTRYLMWRNIEDMDAILAVFRRHDIWAVKPMSPHEAILINFQEN